MPYKKPYKCKLDTSPPSVTLFGRYTDEQPVKIETPMSIDEHRKYVEDNAADAPLTDELYNDRKKYELESILPPPLGFNPTDDEWINFKNICYN